MKPADNHLLAWLQAAAVLGFTPLAAKAVNALAAFLAAISLVACGGGGKDEAPQDSIATTQPPHCATNPQVCK